MMFFVRLFAVFGIALTSLLTRNEFKKMSEKEKKK